MGNLRAPLPAGLWHLVRNAVQELETAGGGFGRPPWARAVRIPIPTAILPVRSEGLGARILPGPGHGGGGREGSDAGPVTAASRSQRWRRRWGHILNLAIAAALSFVLLGCAGVVGLVLAGHHLEQVVTGSMQPVIPIGSIVVSERVRADSLGVGDILVFPRPDKTNQIIVHRIIALNHDAGGNVLVRTKGDFNAEADNWTVERAGPAYADRGKWIVPGAGTAAEWLRRFGFFGLLGLAVGFVGYRGCKQVRKVLADDPASAERARQ